MYRGSGGVDGGVNGGSSTPTTITPVLVWGLHEGITQLPCRSQRSEVRGQPVGEDGGV